MKYSEKRETLIHTAVRLFAERGFHATGIDLIAEEANVTKKTLYHHFRTKDELILASLRYFDGVFRNNFMKNVEAKAESPYERLLAIYDVAHEWFSQNNFFGCMFINAIGEYSEEKTPIRQVCKEFKQLMHDYFESQVIELDITEPNTVANELALLLEGAIVTAQVSGNPDAANDAKKIAKLILSEAMA
ncbi:MAG: TetR/AcrR family transcriptional regulator [Gammaproteobacteria bacterium]